MKFVSYLFLSLISVSSFYTTTAYSWFSPGVTDLMKATRKADLVKMHQLIACGEDVNAVAHRDQPHGGMPVLRYAIDSH